VIEGMMGLYDGIDGKSASGSAAEMAGWLDVPVILVIDAHPLARTAGAIVHGLRQFDPGIKICGIIFKSGRRRRTLPHSRGRRDRDACSRLACPLMPRSKFRNVIWVCIRQKKR